VHWAFHPGLVPIESFRLSYPCCPSHSTRLSVEWGRYELGLGQGAQQDVVQGNAVVREVNDHQLSCSSSGDDADVKKAAQELGYCFASDFAPASVALQLP
jgi:hypothetical protein